MKRKLFLCLLVGLALTVVQIQPTPAIASLIIPLDFEYSGGIPPEGPTPWVTATFENQAANTVRLTMYAENLVDDEFISEWYFNLNPSYDASLLEVAPFDTGAVAGWAFSSENNDFKAGPDGKFDLLFEFTTSNSANRFEGGESVIFDLTYPGLVYDDFDFYSQLQPPPDDKGPFRSAAHIQGIGPDDEDSGWIADNPNAVPESSTLLLLGVGLIGVAGFGRRRIKT